uniref:DUF1015 domain-containing protein n=1 Tax=Thermodesulfobacterium geofontis TaxID=1295609 RepID=A0A7C4NV92_9BACT
MSSLLSIFTNLSLYTKKKLLIRKGFILLVKLSSFEEGKILPHEKTYPKVTTDRFELLKATQFQFSQIFALYEDPSLKTIKNINTKHKELLYEIKQKNETHRLYKIFDKEFIKGLLKFLKDKNFYIADGHHRYETALKFREYMENIYGRDSYKDYNYTAIYICPIEDENLFMFPTHRVYYFENSEEVIKKFFQFAKVKKSLEIDKNYNFNHFFEKASCEWAILFGKEIKIFTLKEEIFEIIKREDPLFSEIPLYNFLQILEKILNIKEEDLKEKGKVKFISQKEELIEEVKKGALGVVFPFISPVILKKVAQAKKLMPHKCTYFYPKILTGLILNEVSGKSLKYNENFYE